MVRIMRPQPLAEKFGWNRDLEAPVLERLQLDAAEPTGEYVLAQFSAQPLLNALPFLR